jgi:exoribonuclease II
MRIIWENDRLSQNAAESSVATNPIIPGELNIPMEIREASANLCSNFHIESRRRLSGENLVVAIILYILGFHQNVI